MSFDVERLRNDTDRKIARELIEEGFEIRLAKAWPPLFRVRGRGVDLTAPNFRGPLRARIAAQLRGVPVVRVNR
ncbi:MAG: hypothetical protein ROZ64_13655 [Burkholderiaceae bacterium]|jgi:hypothetical protein|nr:hypothetical protein [Burkholderiaceae bacterium]